MCRKRTSLQVQLGKAEEAMSTKQNEVKEILIDSTKDLLTDCIPIFITEGMLKDRFEFLTLLKQGSLLIDEDVLLEDETDRVLICGDIFSIKERGAVRIVK